MSELEIFVAGVPGPQGSKSFKGTFRGKDGRVHAIMAESSIKVAPWREDVRAAMLVNGQPRARFEGAVSVFFEFVLTRPKSLKPGKNKPHVTYPDLSKLARSTEDAISSAGIWSDDSAVCSYDGLSKRYAEPGEATGCFIRITDPFPEFTKPAKKGAQHDKPKEPGRAQSAGRGGKPAKGRAAAGIRQKRGRRPPALPHPFA